METYEPKGTRFYDIPSGREMVLISDDEPAAHVRGWLCYRHPDGQWVTFRKATDDDRRRIAAGGEGAQ